MEQTSVTPWYKQRAGIIFISILGILFVLGILFAGLTGYYAWQIRSGQGAELAKQFSDQFTLDPSQRGASASNVISQDPNSIIRAHTPTLGPKDAPVTIVAFIDFECPFCQASYPIFQDIIERYGSAIRVVFKHLPVTQIHPLAYNAHIASTCAHEQGQFWPYYKEVFENKRLASGSLLEYAQNIGLDTTVFERCVNSEKNKPAIDQDLVDAAAFAVRGTPTYTVNQIKLEGVVPKDVWDQVILSEIQQGQ